MMEEKRQICLQGKIRNTMEDSRRPQSKRLPQTPETHQFQQKTSRFTQPNLEMEEKSGAKEGRVECPKMQTPIHQDFLDREGTETAPLNEEEVPPTTMQFLLKVEAVVDVVESSMDVDVVTVERTQPVLGLLVVVEAEWVEEVEEITAHLLEVAAINKSPRVKGQVEDTARTDLSITQPGPGTGAKPVVRVQSMRKCPKEEGREVQRLAVKVEQVTLVTQTRKRTKKTTQRMDLIMSTRLATATCLLHQPELLRQGCSLPEVFLQEGAEEEVVEEETLQGPVPILEEPPVDTESALPPMAVHLSRLPQTGDSKDHHILLDTEIQAVEDMLERRKTKWLI